MAKVQSENKDSAPQPRKLSPEIREFLHMLQALEGHLSTTARSR